MKYEHEFQCHKLDSACPFYTGHLPDDLELSAEQFDELWNLHPKEFNEIHLHGRRVKIPRWQQAFGKNYHFSGQSSKALPTPEILQPILSWCRAEIFERLNGLLLNWYDGKLNHYIGKHRDSVTNMVKGAPIVTVSFGEERTFRLRPWKAKGMTDFSASNGSVFVMPYETNLAWTHEVTKRAKQMDRRISVTLRAFE